MNYFLIYNLSLTLKGVLLVTLKDEGQKMVINSLNDLLTEPARSKEYIALDIRATVLEQSELPLMLANLLPIVDGEIYVELVELTHLAQTLSKECCK